MRSRKWMWISLSLALLFGMGLGVMLDEVVRGDRGGESDGRFHSREPHHSRGRFLSKLDRELDLTEAQKAALRSRLEANHEKARAFWDGVRKDYGTLRGEFRREIRSLLTPEQQARFDAMLAREERVNQEKKDSHREER